MNDNVNEHLSLKITFDSKYIKELDNSGSQEMGIRLEYLFKPYFDIRASLDYPFETGGYSGTLILGESHVNWHSFPEINLLSIDIYSCSPIDLNGILEDVTWKLKPFKIKYKFTKGFKGYHKYPQ